MSEADYPTPGRVDWFGARSIPFLARQTYVLEMRHIFAWGMVVGVVEGSLASVVAAKTFGAGPLLISVAATTPFAAHIASLLWGVLCEGRRKIRLFTFFAAGIALFIASIALTPQSPFGAVLFILQMAAAQFFISGTVTVRSALWRSNYPVDSRAQITARLQKVRAVLRLAAIAIAALIFDYQPSAYRWFYPMIAVLAVVGALLLQPIRVRGEKRELRGRRGDHSIGVIPPGQRMGAAVMAMPGQVFSRVAEVLRRDRDFRRYMIAQFLAGSANFVVRAVIILVVTKQLLVDMRGEYWVSTMLLDGLTMVVMLISMSRFAAYFDRVGVLRFRVAHSVLWTVALILGLAATLVVLKSEQFGPMYVPIAVLGFALFSITRGMCMGAGSLAWNLGHLHFADSADAEVYMGIHVSLTGLRGLIMPGLGMLIWYVSGWVVWLVAIAFSLAALWSFAWMAGREDRINRDQTAQSRRPIRAEDHDEPAATPVTCGK